MTGSVANRRAAQRRGVEAENWVSSELVEAGWDVLARNWRGQGGEIDLVVRRGGVLRFVEVKWRGNHEDGLQSITPDKQRRLGLAASEFLDVTDVVVDEAAFLVVLVTQRGEHLHATWHDDAFEVS